MKLALPNTPQKPHSPCAKHPTSSSRTQIITTPLRTTITSACLLSHPLPLPLLKSLIMLIYELLRWSLRHNVLWRIEHVLFRNSASIHTAELIFFGLIEWSMFQPLFNLPW